MDGFLVGHFCVGRGRDAILQLCFAPQFQTAELLGTVNGDGITVIDSKRPEFFLANELIDQIDLGLFDLAQIDSTQQAEKQLC